MSTATSMTAEQLLLLPDDGMRHELVSGTLTTLPPYGALHGSVVCELTLCLARHIQDHQLGVGFGAEAGFLLARDSDTVRAPDAAFVRTSRIPAGGIPQRGFFPGAPDLAVEVVSPGDTVSEVEEKVQDWLTHGTQEVWVVSPRARTVAVHSSSSGIRVFMASEHLISPALLPGFACLVAELFR